MRDGAGVAGELGYLLFMKSDSATRFKGKPKGSKRVAWCEPLKLPEVKAVSRALGCSINDMLLSCVAGAMRRYLADKGDSTEGVEIRALVPIDLREPGDSELGNRFGILAVELPVGVEHPIERLMTVRQRMLALKTSYEPSTTLGLFAALGYVPKIVQDQLLDLLASRATAVMTNVQGPTEPLTVAGSTAQAVAELGAADRRRRHGRVDLLVCRAGAVRTHHRRRADPRPRGAGQPLSGGIRELPLSRPARLTAGGAGGEDRSIPSAGAPEEDQSKARGGRRGAVGPDASSCAVGATFSFESDGSRTGTLGDTAIGGQTRRNLAITARSSNERNSLFPIYHDHVQC